MKNKIMEQAEQTIASTYNRIPVVLEKGEGTKVWDTEGKSYTDFLAGIAVCNLGHAHPEIARAVSEQAETLVHASNLYYTIPQVEVAIALVENSFADRVFFCNSGAEANEAAIKLARKYFKDRGEKERYRILTMEKSFHGRTMAALSATGQDKIKKGFDPVLQGFDFVPFNDPAALENAIDSTVCAVLTEPIQGEGGVRCPDPGYLKSVRDICDRNGALLIFDEIQTGIGRTGQLFAYQNYDVAPDIMTLAKALANGLPMGAMLARETVAGAFGPGAHASTFGGTPLVTAASREVIRIVSDETFLSDCREKGRYFKEKLQELQSRYACIEDVRGMGLLLGMKLGIKGDGVVQACLEKGFLINCIQDFILRFAPPLIITRPEIDELVECLDEVMGSIDKG